MRRAKFAINQGQQRENFRRVSLTLDNGNLNP